ncbi:MAG: polymer-forming cytoskeletal protein [Patescibacteria group bacterium]
MFTKDEKSKGQTETVIGLSVQVDGNFVGTGDVFVEGVVNGTFKTTGDLRVGSEAKIVADVEAKNIYASGEIRGNKIVAQEKIELTKTAKLSGNVAASVISMEAGAIINGKVKMSSEPMLDTPSTEPLPKKKNGTA